MASPHQTHSPVVSIGSGSLASGDERTGQDLLSQRPNRSTKNAGQDLTPDPVSTVSYVGRWTLDVGRWTFSPFSLPPFSFPAQEKGQASQNLPLDRKSTRLNSSHAN